MGPNGEVQRKGSQAEVLRLVPELRANVAPLHESEALKLDLNAEKLGDSTVRGQHQGKLAILEEVALGRVNRKACMLAPSSAIVVLKRRRQAVLAQHGRSIALAELSGYGKHCSDFQHPANLVAGQVDKTVYC